MDIYDLQEKWQRHWREALEEPTDDMPEDVACDFALHFDIWEIDEAKLNGCFSLFPHGLKMLRRAQELRSMVRERRALNDGELLELLEKLNENVANALEKIGIEREIKENSRKELSP